MPVHCSPVDAFLQTLWEAGPCLCARLQLTEGGGTWLLDPVTLAALVWFVFTFPGRDKHPDSKDMLNSSLGNMQPSNIYKIK